MKITTLTRKSLLTLLVGAFAFSGLIGVSGANTAVAAETGSAAGPQNIDTTHEGKIIIHKLTNPNPAISDSGLGVQKDVPNTEPVPNVKFTYQKVANIDLKSADGWLNATKLGISATGDLTNGTLEGTPTELTTDEHGVATAEHLALGVYLVKETDTPKTVISKSAPFLVTVPYPNNDTATKATTPWLYDVNVYPKNTVLADDERPVKTVKDPTNIHFPGDAITWVIEQKIPKLAAGEKLKSYKFEDALPDTVDAITAADLDAKVTVEVKAADGNTVINATPTKSVDGRTVKVEFATAEANKLTTGATVKITLTTALSRAITGSVENQSATTINDHKFNSVPEGFNPTTDGDPDDPNTTVGTTKLEIFDLKIHKQDSNKKPLEGAQFKVAPAVNNSCDNIDFDTKAYDHNLVSGQNGDANLKVTGGTYCVKEVVAPLGYVLSERVYRIPINKTNSGEPYPIINMKYNEGTTGPNIPELPVTGASGFIIMVLGGSAVIALAVGTGFVAVARKRRNN